VCPERSSGAREVQGPVSLLVSRASGVIQLLRRRNQRRSGENTALLKDDKDQGHDSM